jgi:hypothetical protein
VGLGVFAALREGRAGSVEDRLIGGVDDGARVTGLDQLSRYRKTIAGLVDELL